MKTPPASPPTVRRLLAVSDVVEDSLYRPEVRARFKHVDTLVSCGDLQPSYLDYLASMLDVPLFGVRGNHDWQPEYSEKCDRPYALGMTDLHGKVVNAGGLLLAGLEGSPRYNDGGCQYTELEMRLLAARMIPGLLANRARHGRYLDILVSHAPPRDVNDLPDVAHRGFETIRWLIERFRPRFHLHGHIHLYGNQSARRARLLDTDVINVYGHQELQIDVPAASGRVA